MGLVRVALVVVICAWSRGAGAAPVIDVSPTSYDFGAVRVANAAVTTAAHAFTITNTGDADLIITGITFSGVNAADFSITVGPPFPRTIGPSTSQPWTVTFNPAAVGARAGMMSVASNDPSTADTAITLTGTGTTAVIALADVAFGIVTAGGTSTQSSTLANSAVANVGVLTATSAALMQTSSWFSFGTGLGCTSGTTSCTLSGATAPANKLIPVRCSPPAGASGSQNATLTVTSDTDAGGDSTAQLTCTAGRPDIDLDATALDLGAQFVNTAAPAQTVTVTNTGNTNLTFWFARSGAAASMFSASTSTGCGASMMNQCTVIAGSQIAINVGFTPTSAGAKSATLDITNNDPDTGDSPMTVSLSGTGIAPIASPDPASMSFGNVEVGKMSTAKTLTITNTGTANLTISSAALSAGATHYNVTAGTVGAQTTVIAPTMTVQWSIACAPASAGAKAGNFRIVSNSGGATGNLDVPLTCTGQQGVLALSLTSYNFFGVREGDAAQQNFTLSNTGNVTVSNISATLHPSLVGFSITSPSFPLTLAAGATAIIAVRFAPASSTEGCAVGANSPCTITFSGGWGVTPTMSTAVLVVVGDGLASGYDTIPSAPNGLDFGDVRWDETRTLPISVINSSGTAMQWRSLSITLGTAMSGELSVVSCTHNNVVVPCPTAVAPYNSSGLNDTLVVNVRCDPNERVAMLDATLTVTSDLPSDPNRTVPLKCNSTTATLAVNPSTMVLDFGAVDLDAVPVSVTRVIQLTNTGAAPLNVGTAVKAGAHLARFTFTATSSTVIAPGGSFEVDVTYAPLLEKPPNAPDVASITFPLAGNLGGPSSLVVQITGYGADRHIQIGAAPAFPDTFRNPGAAAPVRGVTVTNAGDATLSISAVMVTNDPVWTVLDPDPVIVPARGTHDVQVRFAPTTAGPAPTGRLVIVNNDDGQPMAEIDLDGIGLSRQVEMGPFEIDLGDTAIGVPVRLSDIAPGELLTVTSMEAQHTFMIASIALDGDAGFTLMTVDGGDASNVELPPLATQGFDVVLTPTRDGTFETTATLYLDMDPEPHAVVTLRGRAARIGVHGGGGCSTGASSGLGMALVVVACLLRRRRAAIVLAMLCAASVASADDINTELFRPTPATHAETFQLQSADVGADGEWAAIAHFTFATNPLAVEATVDGAVVNSDRPVTRRAGFELGGAYAFLDRFEAGLRVPMFQQTGESSSASAFDVPAASGTALGDVSVHGSARLWRADPVSVGASLHVTLPTSTAGQFVGVDGPSARVLALASYRLLPALTVSANLGGVVRGTSTYSNDAAVRIAQGSGIAWGAGASFRATEALRVSAELYGEAVRASDTMSGSLSPMEVLGGVRYRFPGGLLLGVAGGRGITTAVGAPDSRFVLSVAFTPPGGDRLAPVAIIATKPAVVPSVAERDTDHDGVIDRLDGCATAEDKDGFADGDGCPDADNDGDTIADALDRCPDQAEVINGIEDNDGCPDVSDDEGITVSGNLSPTEAAEETFRKGRELMKEGKFKRACAAFEQSQRLDPQQGTQFNIAGCYVEIGKLATAWTMYRALGRTDKNLERRAQANDAAAKLAVRVPKLRVTLSVTPAGLQVFMNGVNANALIGLESPVDFGRYEIVAGAPSFKAWRKTVEITEEGKVTVVNIDLEQLIPASR